MTITFMSDYTMLWKSQDKAYWMDYWELHPRAILNFWQMLAAVAKNMEMMNPGLIDLIHLL